MSSSVGAALFSLDRENVSYGNDVVLRNITLRISEGERVALIGPSGAGKTTLLRTLYERIPDRSAFVHQHYNLVMQLSAFHNVYVGRLDQNTTAYNLLNLIRPQKRVLREIQPILRALEMEDKMFDKTGALSGGQQQRVAVARAIYRGEDLLLADEPVSSVDPHQAGTVLKLILENAKTVVMSLHAVELAMKFAERVIGLRNGEVLFDEPAKKVTHTMLAELYQNG